MIKQSAEAVYEQGAFRPLQPLKIPLHPGQRVRLFIEADDSPNAMLALAADVYDGLSEQEIHEIEAIALARRDLRR